MEAKEEETGRAETELTEGRGKGGLRGGGGAEAVEGTTGGGGEARATRKREESEEKSRWKSE